MFLGVSCVYTTAAPLWRWTTEKYWINLDVMMLGVGLTVLAMLFLGPAPFLPFDRYCKQTCQR